MNLPAWITNASPLTAKLGDYQRADLFGDLIAGLIVAIMLVPQAMAYAMLAGLPPQIGLYASIVPLLLYSFFGSSNCLAVGPVAMVSLLVVAGIGELATPGSPEFIGHCLTLALMIGVIQIAMSVFRLGFLVNFISHPVLIGFTSAAAIVIGASQLKHLFGVSVERTERPFEMIWDSVLAVANFNPATIGLGIVSIGILIFFKTGFVPVTRKLEMPRELANNLSKTGPLIAVVVGSVLVAIFGLQNSNNVNIVGEIPVGLPAITVPGLEWEVVSKLLPLALVITLVGYLESISVAKALARKRREKVDPNRELFALGIADVGAALTGGYPVTGGFSRSMVSFSAGAKTPMAGVIAAALVAVSVALLTPIFFFIPNAVLAAIIMVAIAGLIDFKTPFRLWKYSRTDAIALAVTFLAVLGLGIETGILIGVASTVVMMMWKMSQPHVAKVGRMPGGHGFRNIERHQVQTDPSVFVFRVDESLNFANAPFLESFVLDHLASNSSVSKVVMICSGVNDVDATGIETLEAIDHALHELDVEFCLTDVKGPVTDRLKLAGFDETFLNEQIFLTADQAVNAMGVQLAEPLPVETVDAPVECAESL